MLAVGRIDSGGNVVPLQLDELTKFIFRQRLVGAANRCAALIKIQPLQQLNDSRLVAETIPLWVVLEVED